MKYDLCQRSIGLKIQKKNTKKLSKEFCTNDFEKIQNNYFFSRNQYITNMKKFGGNFILYTLYSFLLSFTSPIPITFIFQIFR